jgi:hypothetical protein
LISLVFLFILNQFLFIYLDFRYTVLTSTSNAGGVSQIESVCFTIALILYGTQGLRQYPPTDPLYKP